MSRRPLGAIVSQLIVAASSLLLSVVALRELGAAGLGRFSLLLGIMMTVNSVQTGWIGDSLTVMDRFDPGIRRALIRSQWVAAVLIAVVTGALAGFVGGINGTTAVLFALASVAWCLEETCRRILIARREFWQLVVNDASFAVGSFGLVALVAMSGNDITIETMVLSLLAGAIVAIGLALVQLPRVELISGPPAPARMRELTDFAAWRSIQVGLRPGTMAVMRAVVATTASLTSLGQLEAARLLIAPVLTIVNGAGVYLLPTYADQARRRAALRPTVRRAMTVVGGLAAAYAVLAILARATLVRGLTDGSTSVSVTALASWAAFSIAFGLGVPAGSALVAHGRSRQTFNIRALDAGIGVIAVSVLAAAGWVDLVPAGLAAGGFVGAALLVKALREIPPDTATNHGDVDPVGAAPMSPVGSIPPPPPPAPAHWRWSPVSDAVATSVIPPPPSPRSGATLREGSTTERPEVTRRTPRRSSNTRRRRIDWHRELLWLVPLIMIVATEYKLRRRNIDEVLTGAIDPLIAAELSVYAVVGVWALRRLAPTKPRIDPLMMILWGYVLTTAVSSLYSAFPTLALARGVQLVIIATVIQLLSSEGTFSTISRLLHGWVVLISVSILIGLAYVFPTTGPQEGRFTWLSVHSVTTGSMFAVSVPVLFGLTLAAGRRKMPWTQWVYGSLFVVHLIFLLLTRTRGSIGGAIVAVAVMAWLSSGRRARPELVLGSLIVGGAFALAFGRQILEFLTRGETVDQIGTFNRRTEIWSLAWDSFLHHPFFGLGFNSAKGVFFDQTGLGGAHNSVINVMIDVGLAGLFWWFLLVIGALVLLGRLRGIERRSPLPLDGATGSARSDELILLGVFVSMLVNSITTEGLGAGVNVMAIWLFLAIAWMTILDRDQRVARAAHAQRVRADRPGRSRRPGGDRQPVTAS